MTEAVLVAETVQVPQEAKAVKDLILNLVQKLHDKEPLALIVASELLPLEKAIANLAELSADAKTPQIAVLAGLLGGQIGEILLTPPKAAASS